MSSGRTKRIILSRVHYIERSRYNKSHCSNWFGSGKKHHISQHHIIEGSLYRESLCILLLLDNVSTHRLDDNEQLSNVKLHFLPPNTTAHLQPLDQGIIYSFKVVIYSCCVMYNYISELTCSFFRLTIGNYSAKTE